MEVASSASYVFHCVLQRPGRVPKAQVISIKLHPKGTSPPARPFSCSGIREPIVLCACGVSASAELYVQSCESHDYGSRITGIVLAWHRASLLGHCEASPAVQDYPMAMDRSKADCQMQQIERPCHASLPARYAVHQSIATITIVVYIWGSPPTILQVLVPLLLYARATL